MLTVTDLFAGFGGASSGAISVPGVEITMAANHWPLAVEVHNLNHENTDHACVDLHLEDPSYFPSTDILWASPECTTWSQAGGHQPELGRALGNWSLFDQIDEELLSDEEDEATRSRLLMFDVLKFIHHHRYAGVIVENVVDIATNPRYATAWRAWQQGLINLDYDFKVVSLNSMHAQAVGDPAPQSRDRLYVVAWPKGNKPPDIERFIRPKAWCPGCETLVESRQAWKNGRTVGKYRTQYVYLCTGCSGLVEPAWLPASSAIDWTLEGTRIGDREKDLAEKTRARIATGILNYWVPLALERAKGLIVPVEGRDGKQARGDHEAFRTMTTRAETGLAVPPFIAELRGGGSDARLVSEPMSTVTASGNHHALVTPYYGSSMSAKPVDEPIGTLTTHDRYGVVEGTGDPVDRETAEAMVDECRFRMLQPHEIGAGMAFPEEYIVKGSKRDQVKGYGNAVTPPAARDIVGALAESMGHEVFA